MILTVAAAGTRKIHKDRSAIGGAAPDLQGRPVGDHLYSGAQTVDVTLPGLNHAHHGETVEFLEVTADGGLVQIQNPCEPTHVRGCGGELIQNLKVHVNAEDPQHVDNARTDAGMSAAFFPKTFHDKPPFGGMNPRAAPTGRQRSLALHPCLFSPF